MAEKRERVTTPEFRVSFPSVFKPSSYSEDQSKKYSLVMLFPKDADLKAMQQLALAAVRAKWGSNIPKNLRKPFRLGEEKPDLDGYEDMIFCTCTSKMKPGVVNQSLEHIIDESEFYAGCWARATVTAYTYGGPGTKFRPGVAFGLQNIQKIRDDEPFSGCVAPEEDFEPLEGGAEDPLAYDEDFNLFGDPEMPEDDIPF